MSELRNLAKAVDATANHSDAFSPAAFTTLAASLGDWTTKTTKKATPK